ncbi:MAG: hypothetical protein WBZ29_15955 [Methanocella sp.]
MIVYISLISATGNASTAENKITDIAMGNVHALALRSDGTVWAWGLNTVGECGIEVNSSTRFILTPVQIPGLDNVIDIAAGEGFSLALKSDGTVWAWGYNGYGVLGESHEIADRGYPEPSMIPGLSDITAIDAGQSYAMALKDDGTVWTWGSNAYGELGNDRDDSTIDMNDYRATAQIVTGVSDVKAIACGTVNGIAIEKDGTTWIWGHSGSLISGGGNSNSTPGLVNTIDDAVLAAAGDDHLVMLKSDGTVWVRGNNWKGKLGNGSKNYHSPSAIEIAYDPIRVPGLDNVIMIDAGIEHSVALLANGTVVAWGGNGMGQIGDGTTNDRNSPITVPVTNAVKISAAGLATMMLDADGNVWVVGDNVHNQTGNAGNSGHSYVTSPVKVAFNNARSASDNTTSSTATPDDSSNDTESTPLPSSQNSGGISPMLLASAGIVVLILAFLVYRAKKR